MSHSYSQHEYSLYQIERHHLPINSHWISPKNKYIFMALMVTQKQIRIKLTLHYYTQKRYRGRNLIFSVQKSGLMWCDLRKLTINQPLSENYCEPIDKISSLCILNIISPFQSNSHTIKNKLFIKIKGCSRPLENTQNCDKNVVIHIETIRNGNCLKRKKKK